MIVDATGTDPQRTSLDPSAKIDDFLRHTDAATPFVVIDTDVVADRYQAMADAITEARIFYAAKANPAGPILERLGALGVGL